MNIRPFDWRDLPALHRYRNQFRYFDSTRLLTRGPALVSAGALLSYLAPATGIFTYLYTDEEREVSALLGQVVHATGTTMARVSFLTPETALETADLTTFFDYISIDIGERGAFHVLAETDERGLAFEILRLSGFAIYARQRIWQLIGEPSGMTEPLESTQTWKVFTEQDLLGVRTLYCNLVPGLVQQIEPAPSNHLKGMVYYQGNELLAYVELKYGIQGIYAQPFIHPDARGVSGRLVELLCSLPNRHSRPVYLCVRSYQYWLEEAIEELGAQPGSPQVVMARHLVVPRRAALQYALPVLEATRPEPTAPFVHSDLVKNDRKTNN